MKDQAYKYYMEARRLHRNLALRRRTPAQWGRARPRPAFKQRFHTIGEDVSLHMEVPHSAPK